GGGGSGGSGSGSSTSAAKPTISLHGPPLAIPIGGSATLNWQADNASSCDAVGAWTTSRGTFGSQVVTGLNQTTTYTLTCAGTGGSQSASVTVDVLGRPPVIALELLPRQVLEGTSAVVRWLTANATSCTASGGWSGVKSTSGEEVLGPVQAATSLVLTCTGPAGSTARTLQVPIVARAPASAPEPIALLSAEFVELAGRAGHEGWVALSEQPLSGGSTPILRLALSGSVATSTFELLNGSGAVLRALTLDRVAASTSALFQGAVTLPGQPFSVRATGTSSTGQAFSVTTRQYTPVPFSARFESIFLATAPGAVFDLPLTLLNSGGARTLHIVVTDSAGIILSQPLTLDRIVDSTPVIATVRLSIPTPSLLPARTELRAVVSDLTSGALTNVSRMAVEISVYN
ncbi:MAG: hypothetical protein ABL964_15195, partial [Steroidobacteraceae bacterium]